MAAPAEEKKPEFGAESTGMQVTDGLDLTGKVIIVTGANSGMGKEKCRILLLRGAKIYMACRNQKTADEARTELVEALKKEKADFDEKLISVMSLDCGSLKSVADFAAKFAALNEPLDFLLNNAGIMALPEYKDSADGYEMQFAVNHLSHFYLSVLLTPLLIKSGGRIVNLSSRGHKFSPPLVDADKCWITDCLAAKSTAPIGKDAYDNFGWTQYGLSKGAQIMFAQEYARKYGKDGVTCVSLHPGDIMTKLGRYLDFKNIPKEVMEGNNIRKSLEAGIATALRCVALSNEEIKNGSFYQDCQEAGSTDALREDYRVKEKVEDADKTVQAKLWELSELLVTEKGFKLALE